VGGAQNRGTTNVLSFKLTTLLLLFVLLLFLFFFLTMNYKRNAFALPEGTDLEASKKLAAATKTFDGYKDPVSTAAALIRMSRSKDEQALAKKSASKFAKSLQRWVPEPKNLQPMEVEMVKALSYEFEYPSNYDPGYFNNAIDACTLDNPKSLLGRIVWGCVSKTTMVFRPDLLRGVIYSLAWSEYGIQQLDENVFSVMNDIAIDSVVEWNFNAEWNGNAN